MFALHIATILHFVKLEVPLFYVFIKSSKKQELIGFLVPQAFIRQCG